MPRPTNKIELIQASNDRYNKMWKMIDSMPEEERMDSFSFDDRDKNIKDVLIHLYEWHQLLLNWITSNQKGESKDFLPKPYNWKTYPAMNVAFWEKHKTTTYEKAKEILNESHKKVMDLVETFSDDELFIKKYFPWTGTTNLGSYCISSTSSHYDWAMKKIKMHIKTFNDK